MSGENRHTKLKRRLDERSRYRTSQVYTEAQSRKSQKALVSILADLRGLADALSDFGSATNNTYAVFTPVLAYLIVAGVLAMTCYMVTVGNAG